MFGIVRRRRRLNQCERNGGDFTALNATFRAELRSIQGERFGNRCVHIAYFVYGGRNNICAALHASISRAPVSDR